MVWIFDLLNEFCNPFITGKFFVDRDIPNVYQCTHFTDNGIQFHSINSLLKTVLSKPHE